ncbi:hypothetical protein AG1IA_08147 [Rhizoctonia solani AG-1 IA]|uniref:Uncharacterized protein n=1 Tax=Thanatephorus cucumeris (strain AG1-IA) TaxID=983506 RepID=L8WNB6_THACA|nr:hypothetical protein AG1IA_08147 [Rhizoctonia solani AG-1 IA]
MVYQFLAAAIILSYIDDAYTKPHCLTKPRQDNTHIDKQAATYPKKLILLPSIHLVHLDNNSTRHLSKQSDSLHYIRCRADPGGALDLEDRSRGERTKRLRVICAFTPARFGTYWSFVRFWSLDSTRPKGEGRGGFPSGPTSGVPCESTNIDVPSELTKQMFQLLRMYPRGEKGGGEGGSAQNPRHQPSVPRRSPESDSIPKKRFVRSPLESVRGIKWNVERWREERRG